MKLRYVSVSDLLIDASDNLKSIFELMEWNAVLLNCLMDHSNINRAWVSVSQEIFFVLISNCQAPTTCNIFIHFMIIASRISINCLYKNLVVKRWKFFALPKHRPLDNICVELIVNIVKVICKQYIKYFSYDGFIVMCDNLTPGKFNDSFKVNSKKIENE